MSESPRRDTYLCEHRREIRSVSSATALPFGIDLLDSRMAGLLDARIG